MNIAIRSRPNSKYTLAKLIRPHEHHSFLDTLARCRTGCDPSAGVVSLFRSSSLSLPRGPEQVMLDYVLRRFAAEVCLTRMQSPFSCRHFISLSSLNLRAIFAVLAFTLSFFSPDFIFDFRWWLALPKSMSVPSSAGKDRVWSIESNILPISLFLLYLHFLAGGPYVSPKNR